MVPPQEGDHKVPNNNRPLFSSVDCAHESSSSWGNHPGSIKQIAALSRKRTHSSSKTPLDAIIELASHRWHIVNAMNKRQIAAMVHIDLSKASTASSIQPYFVNNRIWLLPTKLFCGTVRTSYYSSWGTLGLNSWPDTFQPLHERSNRSRQV